MRLGSAFLSVLAVASLCLAQAHSEMSIATAVRVEAFAVARNGKAAAGWCRDGKVRMWNLPAGQLVRSFELNGAQASQVLLSQDGRWLLVGDSNGGVHVWDSTTGEVRFETALGHYFDTGAFSRDGNMIAVAATGEPAQIFNLQSKQQLFQLTSDFGGPMAVAFSPDGSLIASADTDTAIRVFDTHTGKLRWQFDEMMLEPFAVDFTADGKFVLAGGPSKSLLMLDASSGKAVRSYPKQKDVVRYLEVSPDGSAVAVAYFNEKGSNIPAPVMLTSVPGMSVRSGCRTRRSSAAAGSATDVCCSRPPRRKPCTSGPCGKVLSGGVSYVICGYCRSVSTPKIACCLAISDCTPCRARPIMFASWFSSKT
jgi:WD40 repeat protein